jgi:hypothetical protein
MVTRCGASRPTPPSHDGRSRVGRRHRGVRSGDQEEGLPTSPAQDTDELWTIGHWTCPKPAFLHPLLEHDVELLLDVRAQPGSRRSPQFGADEMPQWLDDAGIDYLHLPELGGRRGRQDMGPEVNAGWQNASFRNYADYTLTPPYHHGLERLQQLARDRRVVVMCGEPMPWRCHRLLIANSLTARGWTVWHLIGDAPPRRHELGQWGAEPVVGPGLEVTYPASPCGVSAATSRPAGRPGRRPR